MVMRLTSAGRAAGHRTRLGSVRVVCRVWLNRQGERQEERRAAAMALPPVAACSSRTRHVQGPLRGLALKGEGEGAGGAAHVALRERGHLQVAAGAGRRWAAATIKWWRPILRASPWPAPCPQLLRSPAKPARRLQAAVSASNTASILNTPNQAAHLVGGLQHGRPLLGLGAHGQGAEDERDQAAHFQTAGLHGGGAAVGTGAAAEGRGAGK